MTLFTDRPTACASIHPDQSQLSGKEWPGNCSQSPQHDSSASIPPDPSVRPFLEWRYKRKTYGFIKSGCQHCLRRQTRWRGGADYIPRHMNVYPLHVMIQYDKYSMNTASTLAGTMDYRPVAASPSMARMPFGTHETV